jgi:hypothetical protein
LAGPEEDNPFDSKKIEKADLPASSFEETRANQPLPFSKLLLLAFISLPFYFSSQEQEL